MHTLRHSSLPSVRLVKTRMQGFATGPYYSWLGTAFEDHLLDGPQMCGKPAECGCDAQRANENRLVKFFDPAIIQNPRSARIFHVKHRESREVVSAGVQFSGRGRRSHVVRGRVSEESYRTAPVRTRPTLVPKKLSSRPSGVRTLSVIRVPNSTPVRFDAMAPSAAKPMLLYS